jgi:hypothetical protein
MPQKQSVKMKKSAQLSSAAAMIPSQVKSPVSPVPGPASPNVPVMLGKKKKKFKSRRIIMDSCDDDDDDDDVVVVESTQRGKKRKTDAEEEEEVKESLEVGKGKKSDLAIVKGEKMDIDPKEESYNQVRHYHNVTARIPEHVLAQVCINCSTKGIDCAWPNIVGNKRVSERRACIQCSSTKVKCEVVGEPKSYGPSHSKISNKIPLVRSGTLAQKSAQNWNFCVITSFTDGRRIYGCIGQTDQAGNFCAGVSEGQGEYSDENCQSGRQVEGV